MVMSFLTQRMALAMQVFLFLFSASIYAQPENNNWLIDGDNWIDFNSGVPVVREPLEFSTTEAAASISDSLGNLIFYTNGYEVYNRLGQVISNLGFPPVDSDGLQSITNGVLILPQIGNPNQYRIISLGQYAIVDMTLNGGLGGMLETPSRIFFDTDFPMTDLGFSEKNHAIRHANGRDWWIIQLRLFRDYENDVFDSVIVSYLYDLTGIHKVNEQRVNLYSSPGITSSYGELIFSKSGDKVAITSGRGVAVYYFDRCAGILGDEVVHLDSISSLYGCAFSPSGRFIYFTKTSGITLSGNNVLYQLDLEEDQYGMNVLTEIYRRDGSNAFANGQLELAPDDKIYMAVGCYVAGTCLLFSALNMNLSVINSPDLPGLSCDFDTLGLYLNGRRTMSALPNTVNYALGPLEGSDCDTLGGSTAVPETATLPQWQITPAVSTGWYSFNGPDQAKLLVYDVWGRTVWQGSATSQQIDLTALPSGLYLVQAKWEDRQQAFRVVKQ